MNEIDPSVNNNGAVTSETYQQASSSSNANKSPLLSSLLTSSKPDNVSNGQQNKDTQLSMMPTPATSSTPNYEESNAFMTKLTTKSIAPENELDLPAAHDSQKKFNCLSDLLSNNNHTKTKIAESSTKSILENCLLKSSPYKAQRSESQNSNNMEEGEYHHPSTSSILKFAHLTDDNRKVEPLKINLNREPIRTVIKLPQSHPYESPSKVAIRTPQLHQERAAITISPTLSSSSSLSSESSFENGSDNGSNQVASSIQVIPKLHIRNAHEGSLSHEPLELHIVPKLTITGLNSPQSLINSAESQCPQLQSFKDHSGNAILETSPTVPKLTIKKDNNTSDYHLNNDANSIPKLHIKTNHHQIKDAKVLAKSSEPPVPKLTIKTTPENDAIIVSASDSVLEQPSLIPKFTIKSNLQSTPKLTIRHVVRPLVEEEELIPKLTLKAVNNSETFEKIVPKLVVKLPKEVSKEEIESASCSLTHSPPPIPKLSIKSIPSLEKEVPKQRKSSVDSTALSDMKFSINRLIGAEETKAEENEEYQPLEIITTSTCRTTDSGQDSPRIILKINKTNSESITSEIVPQHSSENLQKPASHIKRMHAANDNPGGLAKKLKLNHKIVGTKEDVILINDSDTSSSDAMSKIIQSGSKAKKEEQTRIQSDVTSNKSRILQRNLRQLRRKTVLSTTEDLDRDKSQKADLHSSAEFEPLGANNISLNSNLQVDELVTPKRGRGRPKKIVEKVQVADQEAKDPLEINVQVADDMEINEENAGAKKIPGRGRGRGRGRSKRTVEVMKNGKPVQITLEGHDDDDSPSFSLYNRTLKAGFGNSIRKGRGIKVGRGKRFRSSFVTPERSKDEIFTSPIEQNLRRKTFNTPSLFEEDTRMSIGCDSLQATPGRYGELHSTEESQSSLLSSASNTVDGCVKKRQKKIDTNEAEG